MKRFVFGSTLRTLDWLKDNLRELLRMQPTEFRWVATLRDLAFPLEHGNLPELEILVSGQQMVLA